MNLPFSFRFRNQQFWLSAERAMYWEEEKALVVADLHFGKTGHFRKSGLAVPPAVYKEDLQRLLGQIQYFRPEQLIVVGDFFHSRLNKELDLFRKWRSSFPDLQIMLVKGNHDILEAEWYEATGIRVSQPDLVINNFQFVHDITANHAVTAGATAEVMESSCYSITGHIHPGIRIHGIGKQSLSFPCFYFRESFAVLPAFSRFTGLAHMEAHKEEFVFAIVGDRVMQIR